MSGFGGVEPFVRLWRAVLNQAFTDASWDSALIVDPFLYGLHHNVRCRALLWFGEKSQDFYEVCDHANLDPEAVHDYARKKYGILLYDLSSLPTTPLEKGAQHDDT